MHDFITLSDATSYDKSSYSTLQAYLKCTSEKEAVRLLENIVVSWTLT